MQHFFEKNTKIVDEKKAEKYKSSQFVNFDNLRKD